MQVLAQREMMKIQYEIEKAQLPFSAALCTSATLDQRHTIHPQDHLDPLSAKLVKWLTGYFQNENFGKE